MIPKAVVAAAALAALSVLMHMPGSGLPAGLSYSDIYAVYSRVPGGCPVPYLDYKFEYPPLVGALWAFSTCLARGDPAVHYLTHAVALAAAYVAVVWLVARMGGRAAYLLLPSAPLYVAYNWDALAGCLAVAGLYALRRPFTAGLLMGLSASAKLLTAAPALWALLDLALRRAGAARYAAGLLAGLSPFALLAAAAPQGLTAFVGHHAAWYCENCLWMLAIPDIWSPVHRLLYLAALSAAACLLAAARLRGPCGEGCLRLGAFASMASAVVFSYVFTPQMLLMVAPFAALAGVPPALYVATDALNAAFILAFFEDGGLRATLGMEPLYSPWTLDSPAQWIAQARNAALLAAVVASLWRLWKGRKI